MDYSQLLKEYLESLGNSTSIEVSQLTDYHYTADIYYGDEEIDEYLGKGSHIILAFTLINEDSDDNSVGFEVVCEGCEIPGFDMSQGNFYDVNSGVAMALSLLEEVARTAGSFLSSVEIGRELWLSLN